MTEPKQDSSRQQRKRYPGAQPFSDSPEDQQIFFGRDADVDRLFDRVLASRLLVMFSKSGLGKTSLLMAGLFPKLRKEKPLLPVPIRVNASGPPAEIVIGAVTQACKHAGAELTSGNTAGIWEFLLSSLIWSGDLLLTPVLVFDQFEEIFTLRDSAFRTALASELGALAQGIPPERLRTVEGGRSQNGARLGAQAPEVKILLSLREEYLGTLEELSAQIPGLFQERYRLAPLSENEARLAICGPAERVAGPQNAPFATPSFAYDADALREMLTFLQGRSGFIESFQLQLLCCRAEEIIGARAKEVIAAAKRAGRPGVAASEDFDETIPAFRISHTDLGGPAGMQDVLTRFYKHAIGMLVWSDRRRARRLCEEGMVSATGSRIMLEEAQIQSDYGVAGPALRTLVDARLPRCEQRLESLFYEVSHDRLAESIEHSRPFRIPRKFRQMLKGAFVVGLFTIAALLYWNREVQHARSNAEQLVGFLIGERFLDKLRPVGKNEILEEVQSKVEAYLDEADERGVMGSINRFLTKRLPQAGQMHIQGLALRNAGHILRSQGRLDQAIGKFRKSAEVFEGLAATALGSAAMKAEHARSLDKIGESLRDQGKTIESLAAYRKALSLQQELFDAGDRGVNTQIDLAESNSSVGWVLNDMGKPREALTYLNRARELLRPIEASTAQSPQLLTPRLLIALHNAIDNFADSMELIGDMQAAREAHDQARTTTEKFVDLYPLSADARLKHIIATSRVANEQMSLRRVSEAVAHYEQIHRQVDELTRWDKTNASWRRDFAATMVLKADGLTNNEQYGDAIRSYNTALEIFADLAQKDESNVRRKADLHWGYESRGKLALKREQWGQAVKDLTAAEEFIAAASATNKADAAWQRQWALTHLNLAQAYGGENRFSQAAGLFRRGRAILESLIEMAPEMTALVWDLEESYEQEILVLERSGDKTKAAAVTQEKETAYRRGAEKIARATELEPQNASWWRDLSYFRRQIGILRDRSGASENARAEFDIAVKAGRRAVELKPEEGEHWRILYLAQWWLAANIKNAGDNSGAVVLFRDALKNATKAAELMPEDQNIKKHLPDLRALAAIQERVRAPRPQSAGPDRIPRRAARGRY
jgi:tetratricopeptide (TPR) repeat protein